MDTSTVHAGSFALGKTRAARNRVRHGSESVPWWGKSVDDREARREALLEEVRSLRLRLDQATREHKRVEDALRASRARYENLYADAPDMFASVDVDTGRLVQCNRTLVRVSGYTREGLLGCELRELHHPACSPALMGAMQCVRTRGRVRDVELQLRQKDGGMVDVSLSVEAIRDEEHNLYDRCTWRDITERRQAQLTLQAKQRELTRSQAELQALTARLLTAQEDERRRISRELHDDVNQRLAVLALEIDTLERDLPQAEAAMVSRLRALRDRVVALSDDVHGLAYQFHPSILDDLGLRAALEALTDDVRQRESINIEVTQAVSDRVAPEIAHCLYRVTQESLRNAVRHARTARVRLNLQMLDGGIGLVIEDFGVGFDSTVSDTHRRGLGVVGMQERVRLVNGRFSVSSQVGKGTRVEVWVPIPQEAT